MAPAWLDSLSEDWPSQAGSEASPSAQLPPLKPSENSRTPNGKGPGSRIPLPVSRIRPSSAGTDKSVGILSERSTNDVNIPLSSQRRPITKLSREFKPSEQSRQTSHAFTASTTGSVIHNTVQHRSLKSSPLKEAGSTPEWKRRLVYGDVRYGEQRDLFCSAAAGLENMFKPPTPQDTSLADQSPRHESTLPSSPPFFRRAGETTADETVADGSEESDGRSQMDPSPSPSPRVRAPQIHYRATDDSIDQSKLSELSAQRDSNPHEPSAKESIHTAPTSISGLAPPNDASRKTSGNSVIRNEDFSPVVLTLGRLKTDEANVFAPAELPVDQLRNRLEKLRIDQMLLDSQGELQFDADGTLEEPDDDQVENTEDYARRGGFLNLQRGGRSGDGSFKYRGLSPGMGVDTSEMLPEESLQASTPKQFPTVRTYSPGQGSMRYGTQSPPPPRAPHPSPEKRGTAASNSATSPLKLFGPYDTFTNQTLLRRISQFEDQMSGSSRQSVSGAYSADPSRLSEKQRPHTAPVGYLSVPTQQTAASSRSVSQFGAGDLEGYQFNQEISIRREDEESQFFEEDDFESLSGFEESVMRFANVTGSPGQDESMFIPRKRAKSGTTTASSSKHTRAFSSASDGSVQRANVHFPLDDSLLLGTPQRRDTGSEGKRPRTSPSKDPTPKRRRTLHKSDIAYGREERYDALEPVQESHFLMQNMMGKKRKDARPGSLQQRAPPSILATRHILRPRTPTPSSRSSLHQEDYFGEDYLIEDQPQRRSPNRASHMTGSANDRSGTLDTDRKPSIRTQDFLDEAGKIMAMIRNGVKAPSGLTSVEESNAEFGEPSPAFEENSYDESTREPLSRPPSREGKPVQRAPQRQENPEILDYLKKYQELSDMGDVISSSLRSMDQAQDAIRVAQEVERQIEERSRQRANTEELQYLGGDETISDPPNIRISANPNKQPGDSITDVEFPTQSSGASTNRTVHTGSSHNSESRKTIAPQSVSHLIPDQVGSMYLDRQQNIWIKRKGWSIRPRSAHSHSHVLPSEDSEDDPFASIPDLSVDMTKEIQNLRLATAQKEAEADEADWSQSPPASFGTPMNASGKGFVTLSPDAVLPKDIGAQAKTEFSKLGSKRSDGDVEHEIQIDEDRIIDSSPSRRRMTISFSSPIASIIQDVAAEDIDSLEDDEGSVIDSQFVLEESKRSKYQSLTKAARRNLLEQRPRTAPARGPSRQFSLRGKSFVPRPVSRIDERDEDSIAEEYAEERQVSIIADNSPLSHVSQENQERSLSFIVKTPGKTRSGGLFPDAGAFISHHVGNLSLSPMSEFTLHHHEKSLGFEVSYLVDDQRLVTGDGSKKVMSMTVRDLVDRLTEIEPFEPYWEDFTELDISERRLSSLHMLGEFCGRLVSLDASNNSIGHLDGVPASVRQLKITNNMLTELTSWDHLVNLQYVDVSNNDLTSLSALKNLVHLRSLKADNNKLTSLDGLNTHDGLLSLRARNNLIKVVDFDGTNLHRLTELDLAGNRIKELLNVGQLSSLEKLKLARNKLDAFTAEDAQGLDGLRYLDLSDNEMSELDISRLPAVRLLHADRNRIINITGFTKARHLDSLSLREQRGDGQLDLGFLSSAYEVRKLFLSGNYISAFEPKVDFLNLQLLELANCGLHCLPEGLGQLMPNLRSLNLNFNAIADLSPIRFVPRLKKLLIAGNRLADSTTATELLTDFPHLTQLDLRDNPITQGFYPPVQVMVPADRGNFTDPFTLPEADPQRDGLFAKRLDEATRLRRRLYQVIFVGCCKRLKLLDGLSVKRQLMLARDPAFQALVDEGLLPSESTSAPSAVPSKSPAKTPAMGTFRPPSRSSFKISKESAPKASPSIRVTAPDKAPATSPAAKSAVSSRWNAEDSFA